MPFDKGIPLTGQIDQVRYLVTQNAPLYREIMRLFHQKWQQFYYSLTAEDVLNHLHTLGYVSEHLDAVERYLAELVQNGNLTAFATRDGQTTVRTFAHKQMTYTAKPEAIRIEDLLRELEKPVRYGTDLSKSAMSDLWAQLDDLGRSQNLSRDWDAFMHSFEAFARAAGDYLNELSGANKQHLFDHDAFVIYRDTVIRYLTDFAAGLEYYAPRFQQRLLRLEVAGLPAKIAAAITITVQQARPFQDAAAEAEAAQEQTLAQWEALRVWFSARGNAETARRLALDAIGEISRQANRLAAATAQEAWARTGALANLARSFARCETVEQASRLADRVFGAEASRHWKGSIALLPPGKLTSVWRDPPTLRPTLHAVSHGPRERKAKLLASIPDHTAANQQHRLEKAALRQEESRRLDRLFALPGNIFDFTDPPPMDGADWDLIVTLLRKCRIDATVTTLDGSRISLVNRHEATQQPRLARVHGAWGTAYLPPYRLERTLSLRRSNP